MDSIVITIRYDNDYTHQHFMELKNNRSEEAIDIELGQVREVATSMLRQLDELMTGLNKKES